MRRRIESIDAAIWVTVVIAGMLVVGLLLDGRL